MANITINFTINATSPIDCLITYFALYDMVCNNNTGTTLNAPNPSAAVWTQRCFTGPISGVTNLSTTITIPDQYATRCNNQLQMVAFPCCGCNSTDCTSYPDNDNVAIPACINSNSIVRTIPLLSNSSCQRIYISRPSGTINTPLQITDLGTAPYCNCAQPMGVLISDIGNNISTSPVPTDNTKDKINLSVIEFCGSSPTNIQIIDTSTNTDITSSFNIVGYPISSIFNCCTTCTNIKMCNNLSYTVYYTYQRCDGTLASGTLMAGNSTTICLVQGTLHVFGLAASTDMVIDPINGSSTINKLCILGANVGTQMNCNTTPPTGCYWFAP